MDSTFSIKCSNIINQYPDFGVPHSSELCPLLFCIYISDIKHLLNQ